MTQANTTVQKAEPKTQAVAVPPAPALIEVDEGGSLHPNDVRPPMLRVMQGPQAGKFAGQWRYRDEPEDIAHESVQVIPLLVQPTRTKWPEGEYRDDSRPVCWSNDGVKGAPGAAFEGRTCTACPFYTAQPRKGDRQGGRCLPNYMAFLFDAVRGEAVGLRLAGTQTRAADALIGGTHKGGKRVNTHLRKRWLTLTTRMKRIPSGVIYEILASPGSDLSSEEQAGMHALFERAKAVQAMLQPDAGPEDDEVASDPRAQNPPGYTPSAPDKDDDSLPF